MIARNAAYLCQDSCGDKKHKFSGTVSESFEVAAELVNQKTSSDTCQSTELVSVNSGYSTG